MLAKQLVSPWPEKTFLRSSLEPVTLEHIKSFIQWFTKKSAACFFPWLKRQEMERQYPNPSGKSTPCAGTIVILLSLLSGTSPNLSSSHFKNLQMHSPHIYALKFICKGFATERRHLIKKAHKWVVFIMTDLFRFAFTVSSGPPGRWSYTCRAQIWVQNTVWSVGCVLPGPYAAKP